MLLLLPRLSLCCSIYLIVAVTCERYMAVTKPRTRLTSSQKTRATMYILPCVLIATLLNIGKFFEAETVSYCMDFTSCGCGYHEVTYVRPTNLRLSRNYIIFYTTWTWVTMTSLGPFFILSLLNFIIWRKLKAATKTMAELNKTIHHPQVSLTIYHIIYIWHYRHSYKQPRRRRRACPAPPSCSAQCPCSSPATCQGTRLLLTLSGTSSDWYWYLIGIY